MDEGGVRVITRPPGALVDATPAMLHVRTLISKGMGVRPIAERAGVTVRIIYGLRDGRMRSNGKMRPVRRCSPQNLAKILAVEFEPDWTSEGFDGARFRAAREARGLSRRTLARMTGLDECTFQYWETGRSRPKYRDKFEAALNALGVDWEDVSGPAGGDDSYEESFTQAGVDEFIPDYPCLVCGQTFRSRVQLATHPHAKKEVR